MKSGDHEFDCSKKSCANNIFFFLKASTNDFFDGEGGEGVWCDVGEGGGGAVVWCVVVERGGGRVILRSVGGLEGWS